MDDMLLYILNRLPQARGELQQLATATGIPYPTLIKLRTGETTDPRISTVQRLIDHYRAAEGA